MRTGKTKPRQPKTYHDKSPFQEQQFIAELPLGGCFWWKGWDCRRTYFGAYPIEFQNADLAQKALDLAQRARRDTIVSRGELTICPPQTGIAAGTTLATAAHDAGFADSAHFSRTFHWMFGVPASLLLMI